jgi:hypothetical protein
MYRAAPFLSRQVPRSACVVAAAHMPLPFLYLWLSLGLQREAAHGVLGWSLPRSLPRLPSVVLYCLHALSADLPYLLYSLVPPKACSLLSPSHNSHARLKSLLLLVVPNHAESLQAWVARAARGGA